MHLKNLVSCGYLNISVIFLVLGKPQGAKPIDFEVIKEVIRLIRIKHHDKKFKDTELSVLMKISTICKPTVKHRSFIRTENQGPGVLCGLIYTLLDEIIAQMEKIVERKNFQPKGVIFKNTTLQIVIFSFIMVLISNLNAIVDSFLHPEIPYFDQEHLFVGGVTGLVSAILFGLIILYARHLEQALSKIRILESFLPICANCKKIRFSDSQMRLKKESWQSIESYITEHTTTKFSHGICPDCMKKLYPEFTKEEDIGQ